MKNFLQLPGKVDVTSLLVSLQLQPELWDSHNQRKKFANSPHIHTSDIWVRHNDPTKFTGDYKTWVRAECDSVWWPAAEKLVPIKPLIFDLMARCQATRLGAVLITKIPAGKSVLAHADVGWHPMYYNMKLYVPLQANEKCINRVEDEKVVMRAGEVWYFDNTKEHDVVNDGDTDRIVLIVCLKVEK